MILTTQNICSYIDPELSELIHKIILLIKIAVPIVLIIFGMLDLGKAVASSKEDEIKKGRGIFVKRLISAIIVYFIITIVQLVMSVAASGESEVWDCANQIMNGNITETSQSQSENTLVE